jgi:hypothetical protein
MVGGYGLNDLGSIPGRNSPLPHHTVRTEPGAHPVSCPTGAAGSFLRSGAARE